MNFSRRAKNLVSSATMSATLAAQARIKAGEDIVLASVGEPDVAAPPAAQQEVIRQMQHGHSRYGSSGGLLEVREAVAVWMSDLYDQRWSAEHVILTPGSKFALFALLQILCDEKDEVLIPSPYWVSYEALTKLSGAKATIIECQKENGYKLTTKQLLESISDKTKLLILNSPQNPTGAVYSATELTELAKIIEQNTNLIVLCDDIYNQLIFSEQKRAPHLLDVLSPKDHDRIVIVHGASKSFAMTGWRLGWVVAEKKIISKLCEFQSQTLTCIPDFLQLALKQTLRQETSFVAELKESIHARYVRAVQVLNGCPGLRIYPSEGAFYVWIEFLDHSMTSAQVCEELLIQEGVALVPGSAFGCEFHLRLSVSILSEDLDKSLQRVMNYFSKQRSRLP